MIICYSRQYESILSTVFDARVLPLIDRRSVIWRDLITPLPEEVRLVEEAFAVELPDRQESEEIEFSSRFWEDEREITINTRFLVRAKGTIVDVPITFLLREGSLITVRSGGPQLFADYARSLRQNPRLYVSGTQVLSGILAMFIDGDADILEQLSREIVVTGQLRNHHNAPLPWLLQRISSFEASTITIRENLTEKQRILSSLLKSHKFPPATRQELSVMIKDVKSLINTTSFNVKRLDFLRNLFLNHLEIDQNRVIRVFTIISLVFYPPILIASIYGMNFRVLPELAWRYGYSWALCLMALSAVLPLFLFKRRGWL